MQLSLDHEHSTKTDILPAPKIQSPKNVKNNRKVIPPIPPPPPQPNQTLFYTPTIQHQTSSFNFYIDGLQEIRRATASQLTPAIVQAIKERKRFSQQRIYQAIVHTSYDFVGIHMREVNLGMKHEIQKMFEGIHDSVEAGIWDGQYQIGKRNSYSTHRKEQQLITYITEELVKRNIQNFKQQLQQSEVASQILDDSGAYRVKSETKKIQRAEEFVKKMQEQQQKHRQFISKKEEQRHQLIAEGIRSQQTKEQQKKRQKQQQIKRRIQRYNEMKSLELQHKKKMHSEYLKFITQSKKPLYKTMQEKYEEKLLQEQKQKYVKMKQVMDQRKPMSFDDLQQHMQRYDELLQENEQYRAQKRELKEHEMEVIAAKKPYRSKFYSLVMEKTPRLDEKQLKTGKMMRQFDFADYVKRNFVPRVDEKKQQQMQDLVRRISSQNKKVYHSRKYIEEGKRNLERLHLLIGQLRAKNRIKQNNSLQPIPDSTRSAKKYKNYLEQVKQSRIEKAGTQVSVDYDRMLQTKDHGKIRMQALVRQSKARQKDLYLDSAIDTIDFDTHMKGKNQVENHFLEAAKAKMAILKKFNSTIQQ